jgi:pilus assembly protein CpaE
MFFSSDASSNGTRVVVLTADAQFDASVRAIFGASKEIDLTVVSGTITGQGDELAAEDATVVVVDFDATRADEMAMLARLMTRLGGWPPVIAVTQGFDAGLARTLLQMRLADFLVKPVEPADLLRACARVVQSPAGAEPQKQKEAQVYAFLPVGGGAGVTTLAVQTAMILLNSEGRRAKPAACLVDLDFQHGTVADYLDLEPRLNLAEIEHPDRFDRQLLEVMLSYHASGLAVVAAPNRPAEALSFDPDVVMRLLDLVSSNFEYVVFDLPRTWFSWTDSVLLGSNKLFVVSATTVPSLRLGKQLVAAIKERLGERPNPQVIVNRFQQRMFGSGLKLGDLQQVLGGALAAVIPSENELVREAINRGVPLDEIKPGNKITVQLKKLLLDGASKAETKPAPLTQKLKFASAP